MEAATGKLPEDIFLETYEVPDRPCCQCKRWRLIEDVSPIAAGYPFRYGPGWAKAICALDGANIHSRVTCPRWERAWGF